MRIKEFTLPAVTADDNGIATTFQPASGTALTLLVASLSPPREIEITSAGDVDGVGFVIVGTDRNGNPITETLVGPNANTVRSRGVYATITSITPDAAAAVNTTVGWGSRVPGPWVQSNTSIPGDVVAQVATLASAFGGASEATAEFTGEHLTRAPYGLNVDAPVVATPVAVADGETESLTFSIEPNAYYRVVKTGTDPGSLRVRIARPGF